MGCNWLVGHCFFALMGRERGGIVKELILFGPDFIKVEGIAGKMTIILTFSNLNWSKTKNIELYVFNLKEGAPLYDFLGGKN